MILFLDLNSFFASVEQQIQPHLRGRPVGIIPNDCNSTCCIAASYEAKHFGVKTGCGVREAHEKCPGITLVLSRPDEYIKAHHKILEAVDTVYPVQGVHSIDEMSFKLTGPDRNIDRARELAMGMKRAIREIAGEYLRCSIGIAPNRMLAKTASNMMKPDGLVVIERKDIPERLHALDITDFPGIADGIRNRLHRYGIHTTYQLCRASKPTLKRAWGGVLGEIWYHWLKGDEPHIATTKRRNCGHQHVLAPELREAEKARSVAIRLLHKAAARMRYEGFWCTKLTLNIKPVEAPSWDQFLKSHAESLWACDFFTKKVWTRYGPGTAYVLFFIHVKSRRVIASTSTIHPHSEWMALQAKMFLHETREQGMPAPSILIRDGDKKFDKAFHQVLRAADCEAKQIPRGPPVMNAHAERWVRSIKHECLNYFICFSDEHLDHLVEQYLEHYHTERPHQGIGNRLIIPPSHAPPGSGKIVCKTRLGGVLKSYTRVAA